jgi:FkbM family methyltransferase
MESQVTTAAEDGIAIVVLTHNRVHLLRKCVENVLLRTSDATREIVIWDNGSTDGTAEYLATIDDPRFIIVRSETNVGHNGYARGFRKTTAPYFVELDDDVTDAPAEWDRFMLDAFKKLPDVGFLAADLVDDPNDEASQYRHKIRAHMYTPVEENGVNLLTGPAGGGCAMTSREANARAGGFVEHDDKIFWLEDGMYVDALARAGYRAAVLRDLRVHHTGGKYYTEPLKEKDEFWAQYWKTHNRRQAIKRALFRVPGMRALNGRFGWWEAPERSRAGHRVASAWKLSRLGAGVLGRGVLFAEVLVALPVKQRLRPGAALPARVDLGDGRAIRFWFSDDSELIALHEIVFENEYAVVDGAPVETIVDLGANVGQAALWFLSRNPSARILSVECDPTTFSKLERNLGKHPRATLRNAAIARTDGTVSLERTPHSSWGTRVTEGGDVTVPALSLESLLEAEGIERADLLKVDIEGMEHEALGASAALERAGVVVGELHASLLSVSMEDALEDMRRSGGFEHSALDGDIFVLSRA